MDFYHEGCMVELADKVAAEPSDIKLVDGALAPVRRSRLSDGISAEVLSRCLSTISVTVYK